MNNLLAICILVVYGGFCFHLGMEKTRTVTKEKIVMVEERKNICGNWGTKKKMSDNEFSALVAAIPVSALGVKP